MNSPPEAAPVEAEKLLTPLEQLREELFTVMMAANDLERHINYFIARYEGGMWTPQESEKFWSVLLGPPRTFPYESVPTREELRNGCTEHLNRCERDRTPMPAFPPPPVRVRVAAVTLSHEERMAQMHADIRYYKELHAYYLLLIEQHSLPRGQDLCWEDVDVLRRAMIAVRNFGAEDKRPSYDECSNECERFRRMLYRGMKKHEESLPTLETSPFTCPDGQKCHDHTGSLAQFFHNLHCNIVQNCPRAKHGRERQTDDVPVLEARNVAERFLKSLDVIIGK